MEDGRRRVVIENVAPEIDCGRFPAKGSIGEPVLVEADVFGDGHDLLSAVLMWREVGGPESGWREEPMTLLRIYVVDPDLETHVRKLQKETGAFPGFGPTQVLADHPDELRAIVISYYGPKNDVEAIARKIDVAALRRLLPS